MKKLTVSLSSWSSPFNSALFDMRFMVQPNSGDSFHVIFLADPHLYTVFTSRCLPIETIPDNGHVTLVRVNEFQPKPSQESCKPYVKPRPGHTARVSTTS